MLLNLPTELIQLVLRRCDTPAYLQAAFASRTLFEIAASSRDVISHHLYQTPGLTSGIEALQTRELFAMLLKRSSQQLYGAEFHAGRKIFDFQNRVIDRRASTLDTSNDRNRVLLVFTDHSSVYLFHIGDGHLTLEHRLNSPGRRLGHIQVLRTAFDADHGVYVLHRFKPFINQELETDHPFVQQALRSNSKGNVFLAYHDLNSPSSAIRMCGFPDHDDYEPLALAVSGNRFAISWQHVQDPSDHEVVLYTMFDEDEDVDEEEEEDGSSDHGSEDSHITYITYEPYVLAERNEQGSSDNALEAMGPAVRLAFNDRGLQLLHHYRAHTLYGSFQRISWIPSPDQPRPKLSKNACIVPFSSSLSLRFSIDIPFFGTHHAGDVAQGILCHWQYLAFGIATHRVEQWTVACLLKSEAFCRASHCGHVLNLDRGRRFENWEIMAQLGGFQETTTSHGSRVAASRLGTRIAVANWRTVSIWALEPNVLTEGNDGFYLPSSQSSRSGIIELRPVLLQLDAVCSQLRFTDKEDELVAITDRGLLYLNLGPEGRGIRMTDSHGHGVIEADGP